MRIRWISRLALAMGVTGLAASVAVGGAGRAQATPGARATARTFSTNGTLAGVAAVSAKSAWAVGYAGSPFKGKATTLMLHWNGSTWAKVTKPAVVNGVAGEILGITAVSATDAWAVGFTGQQANVRTLILHWNGRSWSAVPTPKPVAGELAAVTATASSGWAVGTTFTATAEEPLILHLKGGTWSRAAAPVIKVGGTLESVAVTGPSATWAGGAGLTTGRFVGLLAQWNGKTWKPAAGLPGMAAFIYGAAAGPGGTAWAVGAALGNGTEETPLVLRWSGKAWAKMATPGSYGQLYAVTVAPGGAVWTVGQSATLYRLIARWNGKVWVEFPSPTLTTEGFLFGIAFTSASSGWAVGGTYGLNSQHTIILHWNGTSWS